MMDKMAMAVLRLSQWEEMAEGHSELEEDTEELKLEEIFLQMELLISPEEVAGVQRRLNHSAETEPLDKLLSISKHICKMK
jgi:hypothetical protein